MSKTDRAKKRAAEKASRVTAAPVGMPNFALRPSRKRDKSGCFVERQRQKRDDPKPMETVLKARCRRLGLTANGANMLKVNSGMLSDPAGQAVFLTHSSQARRDALWKTFCDLDRAEAVYFARILKAARFAKCGKVEFIPERLTSENAPAPDGRTEEEKDQSAVNGWMHWRGLAQRLGSRRMTALYDGVWMRAELVEAGAVTPAGAAFVSALEDLTAIATGSRR